MNIHLQLFLSNVRVPESFLGISIGYTVFLIINIALYAIFALGLNLQWGFTGLINFGHVAFMTLGVYTTVLLSLAGVPLILAVIAGSILAALLGLLIGLSTLRLREDYLAIVTIGTSEVVRLIVKNEAWLTKGSAGIQGYPRPLEDLEPGLLQQFLMTGTITVIGTIALWQLWRQFHKEWSKPAKRFQKVTLVIGGAIALILVIFTCIVSFISFADYNPKVGLMFLSIVVLAIIYWSLEFLVRSPWGRVLKAIREDEEIPKALGKNVFWYKLQAFTIGGAIAGIAGAFYAWQFSVYPDNFEPLITFNTWVIVVLGGAGNNLGTILGAIIFWVSFEPLTRYLTSSELGILKPDQQGSVRIMLIGLILMILMLWQPQGILGKKEELTLNK
ncbi:branched-chain amino acid ABC transporter permease [Gloeocapsa sp. PCC 73106]|uniref:branched-chain amino acid ABC transporter permease n=1 Tax=Gloeocapsa sp. PCC 73106 TaxID=102232 RepID=UPI0002ACC109|nr:branched-chain amino acid ABC transporter permease [Gloeocapsa sp. PCC 73106]ELR98333.1 ABC-type branched-chain amino acid transport system, permease component [Gloeocapsa sp. PCC 73106]